MRTSMDRFAKAAAAFKELVETMARLRAPGGCPWDREQTYATLKTYLLEETYEVLEAMDGRDAKHHCEELGDLLLQVVFQAEIANEKGDFSVGQVAESIQQKLVRRHPHVFGDAKVAKDASSALKNWETIKAAERPVDTSCLDGVPKTLPALLRALRTGEKAAAVGFDWSDARGALAKVHEEVRELQNELDAGAHPDRLYEELGDLLYALTSLARHLRMDPEASLRSAIEKFEKRFRHMERFAQSNQTTLKNLTFDELDALWNQAKQQSVQNS